MVNCNPKQKNAYFLFMINLITQTKEKYRMGRRFELKICGTVHRRYSAILNGKAHEIKPECNTGPQHSRVGDLFTWERQGISVAGSVGKPRAPLTHMCTAADGLIKQHFVDRLQFSGL